jgi:hypothetical protein
LQLLGGAGITGNLYVGGNLSIAGNTIFTGTVTATTITSPAATNLTIQSAGTTAMTIDTSQNVGIGTSSPGAKLQVNGIIQSGATGTNGNIQFLRSSDGAAAGSLSWDSTNTALAMNNGVGTGVLTFLTNSGERMRIDSSGNVGINTSSPVSRLTSYQNVVNNNILSLSPSSGMTHFLVSTTLPTSGGSDAFAAYDAGGISARITTNGYFQSRPNSYGSTSDERLKDNIVDATPKLADIMQVRVRNFNYKDQPGEKQLGVIAQELETVFPSLVHEIPNANPQLTDSDTVKSVKYSVFVPMLIKAIQELKATVDAQAAEITALKVKVGT